MTLLSDPISDPSQSPTVAAGSVGMRLPEQNVRFQKLKQWLNKWNYPTVFDEMR